jgi:CBS domain-containing protein
MTEFVIFGSDTQDIKEAARLMMDNQIRRLLVLDRDKELVGVVSLGDLSKALDDKSLAGQMLEQISEATLPRTLEHIG